MYIRNYRLNKFIVGPPVDGDLERFALMHASGESRSWPTWTRARGSGIHVRHEITRSDRRR